MQPRNRPTPKAEPCRVDLDTACARLDALVRAAVETPNKRNLDALKSAVMDAHESLITLNFVETVLATEEAR